MRQISNVDGRCDGDEMSTRDQREGTSLSDRVKEDVSLEYFTLSNRFDGGVSRDKLRAGDKSSSPNGNFSTP